MKSPLSIFIFFFIFSAAFIFCEPGYKSRGYFIPEECLSYEEIDEPTRNVLYTGKFDSPICDRDYPHRNRGSKWVRFLMNGYNARVPYRLPGKYSCNSHAGGYISKFEDIYQDLKLFHTKNIDICYSYRSDHCYGGAISSRVTKCDGYYVFKFPKPRVCFLRLCVEQEQELMSFSCFKKDKNDPKCCNGNGKCQSMNHCECNDGWEGKECEINNFNCFGINKNDPTVCSGNGVCQSKDICKCNSGYQGNKCQYRSQNHHMFEDWYNIESNRLQCAGSNLYGICGGKLEDTTSKLQIFSNLGNLEPKKTIRSICSNKYWTIATDSLFRLYIWGDSNDNNYISSSSSISKPIKISWGRRVKKVACSGSSLFILNFDGTIFAMGKNEFFEFSDVQGTKWKEFHQLFPSNTNDFVINVFANSQNVYILTNKHQISISGMKFDNLNHFQPFTTLDTSLFPSTEIPRLILVDQGCFFLFSNNVNFFAGRNHPSYTNSVIVIHPKRINFVSLPSTGSNGLKYLGNDHSIDLAARMENGCLLISSNNKIYISGTSPSCIIPSNSIYPHEISEDSYGSKLFSLLFSSKSINYKQEQRIIYDLKCVKSICLLLTPFETFIFGRKIKKFFPSFTKDSSDHFIPLTNQERTTNFKFLIPGINTFNFMTFSNPKEIGREGEGEGGIRLIDSNSVNKYPPSFIRYKSMLTDNYLNVIIKKPETFGTMEEEIEFIDATNPTYCNYSPYLVTNINESIWRLDNYEGYDYYTSSSPFSNHLKHCGWEKHENKRYEIYDSTVKFRERFFLSYENSFIQERIEEFSLNLRLKFKKFVYFNLKIFALPKKDKDCEKDDPDPTEIDTEMIVLEKLWNKTLNKAEIFIRLKTKQKEKGSDSSGFGNYVVVSSDPQKFVEGSIKVYELTGKKQVIGSIIYQYLMLEYVLRNNRCDPSSNFTIIAGGGGLKRVDSAKRSTETVVDSGTQRRCGSWCRNEGNNWGYKFDYEYDFRNIHKGEYYDDYYYDDNYDFKENHNFCNKKHSRCSYENQCCSCGCSLPPLPPCHDDDDDDDDTTDEARFVVQVNSENTCAMIEERVDLTGKISLFADFYHQIPRTHFKLDDYGYFLVDLSVLQTNIGIKSIEFIQIVFENQLFLMKNKQITIDGQDVGLVITGKPQNSATNGQMGFHFQFIQKILGMKYGESKTFNVATTVAVTYNDNRRRLIVENTKIGRRGGVPPIEGLSAFVSQDVSTSFEVIDNSVTIILSLVITFSIISGCLLSCSLIVLLLFIFFKYQIQKNTHNSTIIPSSSTKKEKEASINSNSSNETKQNCTNNTHRNPYSMGTMRNNFLK